MMAMGKLAVVYAVLTGCAGPAFTDLPAPGAAGATGNVGSEAGASGQPTGASGEAVAEAGGTSRGEPSGVAGMGGEAQTYTGPPVVGIASNADPAQTTVEAHGLTIGDATACELTVSAPSYGSSIVLGYGPNLLVNGAIVASVQGRDDQTVGLVETAVATIVTTDGTPLAVKSGDVLAWAIHRVARAGGPWSPVTDVSGASIACGGETLKAGDVLDQEERAMAEACRKYTARKPDRL